MKQISLLIFVMLSICIYAQPDESPLNTTLLAHMEFNEDANDIWGYVDANGIEYAIVGTRTATRIISLEDPTDPIEVAAIAGVSSIWRDIKSYEDHLYVTTDQGADGLVIIDMSGAPDNITSSNWKPTIQGEPLNKCHNLYIDDGYCYLAGCNVGEGGIIILDLHQDKDLPVLVGLEDEYYSHDIYVRGNLMYTSEIYRGKFGIYDITDKSNPEYIGGEVTSFDFTHNAWTSDNDEYLYTTDERGNAFLDSWNISDNNNYVKVDRFRPLDTEGQGAIPHNTHVLDEYLVTSWYTEGVRIIDGNKPDNLVEVAKYDSWQGASGGFSGCWGAYPYLPSGNLIISDINSGLYILDVDYKRASYLEGTIRDEATGAPIVNATIVIEAPTLNRKMSNLTGEYKTGTIDNGTFNVLISHSNYKDVETTATLVSGEVTILDINMNQTIQDISVIDEDGNPVANAHILVSDTFNNENTEYTADENGYIGAGVRGGNSFDFYASSWGYKGALLPSHFVSDDVNPEAIVITLTKGYEDDFFVDLGWQIDGTAPAGIWSRGIPNETESNGIIINPGTDSENDLGSMAYVTGNASGASWSSDDIDDGYTLLTSPNMDWTNYAIAQIEFDTWYVIGGNGIPDDTLIVYLNNGIDDIIIHREAELRDDWRSNIIDITLDQIEFTDQMTISYRASDENTGNIVEAGIDHFSVQLFIESSTTNIDPNWQLTVSPNPFNSGLVVKSVNTSKSTIIVRDILGKIVVQKPFNSQKNILTQDWSKGVYFIQLISADRSSSVVSKVVKN